MEVLQGNNKEPIEKKSENLLEKKSKQPFFFFYLNVKQKMQGWAIWKFIIYLTSKSQNQFYMLPQVTEVITAEGQNIGKASLSKCFNLAAEYLTNGRRTARNSKRKELE